jgi:hypothetical protein
MLARSTLHVAKEAALSDVKCPHCGGVHEASVVFCPTTGGAVPGTGPAASSTGPAASSTGPAASSTGPAASTTGAAASATAPGLGAPDKGVADILKEAYDLYRKHARALLITCAVLFVPASVVKSCAVAAIMAPAAAAAASLAATAEMQSGDLEASKQALQEAYKHNADAATLAKLQTEQARVLTELARRSTLAARAAMGSFTLFILGLLGTLVTAFFVYGVVVPLTNGALTITVADRILGGDAGWREVWMLLFRKLGPLLTAVIPAAFLIAIGFVVFIIPGVILGLLFAFVSPVVLIEGRRGRAALQRSAELVASDWLRVAIMILVFGVLRWAAQLIAGVLVPSSALFISSLFGDLVTMVFLPLPVLGMVLLYFDIRRKRDNFTPDRLRADLEALKSA